MNDSTITTQPETQPDAVDRFVAIANKATKAGFAAAFGMAAGNRVRVRAHTRRRPRRRRK